MERGSREECGPEAGWRFDDVGADYRNDESEKMIRNQVFISYSHVDARFLEEVAHSAQALLAQGCFQSMV